MSEIKFQKRLQRIAGEIRFRPTLAAWQGGLEVAKKVEPEFEHWQISEGGDQGDIVLLTLAEKRMLRIKYNSIVYTNEKVNDTADLLRLQKLVFDKNIKNLGIQELKHVGFRNVSLYETNILFEELVQLMNERLLNQNQKIKDLSGDDIRDIAFILDGGSNGILNHVKIGPVTKDEGLKYFSPKFKLDSDDELKDDTAFVYIDIDTYVSERVNADNAVEVLEKNIAENKRITDGYIEYLTTANDE